MAESTTNRCFKIKSMGIKDRFFTSVLLTSFWCQKPNDCPKKSPLRRGSHKIIWKNGVVLAFPAKRDGAVCLARVWGCHWPVEKQASKDWALAGDFAANVSKKSRKNAPLTGNLALARLRCLNGNKTFFTPKPVFPNQLPIISCFRYKKGVGQKTDAFFLKTLVRVF